MNTWVQRRYAEKEDNIESMYRERMNSLRLSTNANYKGKVDYKLPTTKEKVDYKLPITKEKH
jgi:hypothetical protein